MTVNQVIAFCLVAVLIGFLVVMAKMATEAVDLLKKVKGLVNKGTAALDDIKSRADKLADKAMTAANKVIADSSIGVKAVATVGIGLTAVTVGSSIIKSLLRTVGILPSRATARKERKIAAREIKLSKKALQEMNRQSEAERKAFARAERQSRKLRKKELANAKKEAKIAAAEERIAARLAIKEQKAAAKAARIDQALAEKAAKAELIAAIKAEKLEQKLAAKAEKLEQKLAAKAAAAAKRGETKAKVLETVAFVGSLIADISAASKEKKQIKNAEKRAVIKAKKADKKQMKKLSRQNRRSAAKSERCAKRIAKKTAARAAKKLKRAQLKEKAA